MQWPHCLEGYGGGAEDIAHLKAALSGAAHRGVYDRCLARSDRAFPANEYYPSREAYLARLADVMKEEYDAIYQGRIRAPVDCPDLAMGRHLAFPDLSTAAFVKVAEANIEALNHALRDIPPDRLRLHLCWGNYEGRTTATFRSEIFCLLC